jgi:periodic tryptophan protein 2
LVFTTQPSLSDASLRD